MKEIFKDKRGWISLAIILIGIVVIGNMKLLTKNTNFTMILLVCIATVAVVVMHSGKKESE